MPHISFSEEFIHVRRAINMQDVTWQDLDSQDNRLLETGWSNDQEKVILPGFPKHTAHLPLAKGGKDWMKGRSSFLQNNTTQNGVMRRMLWLA